MTRVLNITGVLNMPLVLHNQGFEYTRLLNNQGSEYVMVLNIFLVLNNLSSEYASGSECARVLNITGF